MVRPVRADASAAGCLGDSDELPTHVRITADTSAAEHNVIQAFLHVALNAGVPNAHDAFMLAKQGHAETEERL
jgi:alkylhydroperoxidase/carboxymuconolactone decarboxylase family protein YurZ